ncbi:hypothetical protein PYW08_005793 [Mythimna loreyi]|uniref:Uncharacterized protein n=1 Tax=Mythimna loreyi TaxID=667449 RepID=A0ACC2QK28_9NEOP|nr:hypothetical protein PYW08_005793 [Mythimna loreyi]
MPLQLINYLANTTPKSAVNSQGPCAVLSVNMTAMARVSLKEVYRFVKDCMIAVGSPAKAADQVADLLVDADKLGHRSHGLNRLERYVVDIKAGRCAPNNEMKIEKETASTAWINANNVLGATSANYASDLAIKKAEETGIGWICTRASNHYGIGGYWAKKIASRGMIGMSFSNGSPLVAPTRSTKAALGSNPIAVCAPALSSTGPFYLDIATATVALGKLEMYRRRGKPLEPGWAAGPDGNETLDADLAIKSGSLLPLGGTEKSSGYKGFGLSALVDMLSGVLSGAQYAHHVPRWSPHETRPADLGHSFAALDHKCFAPGFEERVSDCISYWRQMTPSDPKYPVLAPGDLEKKSYAEADATGVIVYIVAMLESYDVLANELKVEPIERIKIMS